jgi:hypothetical protein
VIELRLLGTKTGFDVAETFPEGKLRGADLARVLVIAEYSFRFGTGFSAF